MMLLSFLGVRAQQSYFEGEISFRILTHSNTRVLNDVEVEKMMAHGGVETHVVKGSSYLVHSALCNAWVIGSEKRAYYKYPKLDTLYYENFSSDTAAILEVIKGKDAVEIAGHSCESLVTRGNDFTRSYLFAKDLFLKGDQAVADGAGPYGTYMLQTRGPVYLLKKQVYNFATITDSCTGIDAHPVDDHVFDRPGLPVKEMVAGELISLAHFKGGDAAFLKYLNSQLDPALAIKYVKLPKGQQEASVQVLVEFSVGIDGSVSDVQVVGDTKGVHSKLVQEALRVVGASPRWIPANFYGEKLKTRKIQPVIYKVVVQS